METWDSDGIVNSDREKLFYELNQKNCLCKGGTVRRDTESFHVTPRYIRRLGIRRNNIESFLIITPSDAFENFLQSVVEALERAFEYHSRRR